MNTLSVGVVSIALVVLATSAFAVTIDVEATSVPWLFVNGGLNTDYQFGTYPSGSINGPSIVSATSDLPFLAGDILTITYLSGLANPYGGYTCPGIYCSDANGEVGLPGSGTNEHPGGTGAYNPSKYIPSSEYDVWLMTLVGVFADSSGTIIGTPHKLGNGPTSLVIPVGAARFQMGVNDDRFDDNYGSYTVQVSEAAVPEPAFFPVLTIGLGGILAAVKLRKRAL